MIIIMKRITLVALLIVGTLLIGSLGSGCSSIYEVTHKDGSKEYIRAWGATPQGNYVNIMVKGAPNRLIRAYAVKKVTNKKLESK